MVMKGGCNIDPEECNCSCHRDGGSHVAACCFYCDMCDKRIRIHVDKETHKKDCREKSIASIKELHKAIKELDKKRK